MPRRVNATRTKQRNNLDRTIAEYAARIPNFLVCFNAVFVRAGKFMIIVFVLWGERDTPKPPKKSTVHSQLGVLIDSPELMRPKLIPSWRAWYRTRSRAIAVRDPTIVSSWAD